MSQFPTTWEKMPEQAQRTLDAYLRDATKTLGADVGAIILYGSLARGDYLQDRSNMNILMVFEHLTMNMMERCSQLNRRWSKERILAPLMFTREEIGRFLETFPLEFYEIQDHHILLAGRDPFPELHIEGRHLFNECEREIRGNLLRVRQQFIEARGNPEGIHALLPISLTTVIPCLRGLYRLIEQSSKGTPDDILNRMPSILNLEPGAFHEVWLLKRGQSTPGKHDFPNLLNRYLGALEALAARVDVLDQEGRFQGGKS